MRGAPEDKRLETQTSDPIVGAPSTPIMKSIPAVFALLLTSTLATAQLENDPSTKKKDWTKVDLTKRSSDHIMIQFGYHGWQTRTDTVGTTGFSRTFNMYFLFDFPFKTSPRWSVGVGAGVGTDNAFFENTTINLKDRVEVEFQRDTITKYRKYKLATGYLEAPLELRYSSNPSNMNAGFKAALGVKVGLPIDGHTKAKVDRDANGFAGYVAKEKDRRHVNNTRIAATARVGYGNVTVFGTYSLTPLFREAQGPIVRPWTVGICLSGL